MCIITKGLKGSEVANLPQTEEELRAHMETHRVECVKPGDEVIRLVGGVIPYKMIVSEATETRIKCVLTEHDLATFRKDFPTMCAPDWDFDRETGAEEDAELGWGKAFGVTGSWIFRP